MEFPEEVISITIRINKLGEMTPAELQRNCAISLLTITSLKNEVKLYHSMNQKISDDLIKKIF